MLLRTSGFLFKQISGYAVFRRRKKKTTPIKAAALMPTRATGTLGEVVGCACRDSSVTALGPKIH